jgi:hypothetical protein
MTEFPVIGVANCFLAFLRFGRWPACTACPYRLNLALHRRNMRAINRYRTLLRPAQVRYLLMAISLSCPLSLLAQKPAGAGTGTTSLPDSPQPKQQPTTQDSNQDTTTKFIGYMSNRSIAFPDIASKPGPLSVGEKFKLFANQSISPPYLLAAAFSAGVSQWRDVPAAYGQGWDAYGGRYGAALARASSNSFFSTFVFASVLHHDPRFFPQSHPTFWGSVKYSAERLVVSRNDAGNEVANVSGLLGPLAAESLANVYLPRSEQNVSKTAERYGTDMAWRFAGNMFKNYWPTIFHRFQLQRLKVVPGPPQDTPPPTPPNK